jgi:hypothetical protein
VWFLTLHFHDYTAFVAGGKWRPGCDNGWNMLAFMSAANVR